MRSLSRPGSPGCRLEIAEVFSINVAQLAKFIDAMTHIDAGVTSDKSSKKSLTKESDLNLLELLKNENRRVRR